MVHEHNDRQAYALEARILANIVAKLAGRDLERRLIESGSGVSGLQLGVLRLLSRGNATLSELSNRMLLSPATLVPVVDALERKGLAQRRHDPHDRRRAPLALTPAGAGLVAQASAVTENDGLAQALEAMGDEKTDHLLSLLRELVSHMTDGEEVPERVRLIVHG